MVFWFGGVFDSGFRIQDRGLSHCQLFYRKARETSSFNSKALDGRSAELSGLGSTVFGCRVDLSPQPGTSLIPPPLLPPMTNLRL